MTDKPRRAWFQLHLSTAIVLMLGCGAMLGLNIVPVNRAYNVRLGMSSPSRSMYIERGWPVLYSRAYSRQLEPDEFSSAVEAQLAGDFEFFSAQRLAYGVLISFGSLLLLAGCCEFVIRRREVRAP